MSVYTHAQRILRISSGADQKAIRQAYLALVRHTHPDLYLRKSANEYRMATLRFKEISEAYQLLLKRSCSATNSGIRAAKDSIHWEDLPGRRRQRLNAEQRHASFAFLLFFSSSITLLAVRPWESIPRGRSRPS
mmetsp:Transcript_4886/g.7630  ORF Transcript_4886/g.7630 Transcript_4886/m.7630 type:complete len:134 (-) Transcript_4886:84-485(-)